MIEAREKIIGCCETLAEKVKDAVITGDTAGKITAIAGNAREQQLVVPVVGAFSSGKSTMINSLIGTDILPVDIKPETSLATELHYSTENFILAVKESGEPDRYKATVEEIKTVKDNAANYLFAQLFLNNDKLRAIEPLVLVDMPGFDSPLDLHNKAIMSYLDRGCYYIVLSSIEEGTITSSLERRLRDIEGLGRDFSFFLSKANLRPKDSVDSLVSHYRNQLADKFECKTTVVPLEKSADDVLKCLKSIDINAVFLKIYRDTLLDVCSDIITNINIQINASKKDAEKLKAAIAEMKNGVDKLRKKMDSDIEDMRRRYSGTFINDIIADVGGALESSLDELSGIAIAGDKEALERHLNEIVRSALISSIREKLNGINRQITVDFSESLQDLDRIMKDMDLDENYLKNITEKVENALKIFDVLLSGDGTLAGPIASPEGSPISGIKTVSALGLATIAAKPLVGIGAKAVGGTAAFINPIIAIVIMFLPEIIGAFAKLFGGDPKEKQKEAVRSKFAGEVFPSIKRRLREEIPATLDEPITAMINNVKEQFETQIKNQEEAINTQMEQENTNVAEKEAAQQKLATIRSDVQDITNQIMAWGK